MKIRKKLPVNITFTNGEAERVQAFYISHKLTHREIYMKGIRAIEGK